VTIRGAAFAVLLLATSGVVEAADGGVQEHPRSGAPGRAPGAFLGPLPAAGDTGSAEVEGRYPLTARPGGGAFYDSPQFSATVAPDGTVTFHDHRLRYARRDAVLNFDLSDEFSRELARGTLYRHEKANFLAATFRQRTDMAARAYAVRMRAALEELPARLDALWADTRYRRRERRRIIFLLWAEADRSSSVGRSADAIIEGWIRRRLPPGSSNAYSKSEMEALSRERPGLTPFSPYGSLLEMRAPQ
jgi:hypothetical protein